MATSRKKAGNPPITFETVRALALALPEVEEGMSYGTPAFRVKKKFMLRLREDGDSVVFKVGFDESEILMQSDPQTFYTTDHYRGYPSVLARLSQISVEQLGDVIRMSWRFAAPKRLRDRSER